MSNAVTRFRNYPAGPFNPEAVAYLFGQARTKFTSYPLTYHYQYRPFMSELAFYAIHKLGMDMPSYNFDIV
jgi:hypothetical protein